MPDMDQMGELGAGLDNMDPMLRRMLIARVLQGNQNAAPMQMPQGSPMGAAMTGFANGMGQGQNLRKLFGGGQQFPGVPRSSLPMPASKPTDYM